MKVGIWALSCLAAASLLHCQPGTNGDKDACQTFPTDQLKAANTSLYVNSRLRSDGLLQVGNLASCSRNPFARRLLLQAIELRRRHPSLLEQRPLRLHLGVPAASGTPSVARLETHTASGDLLLDLAARNIPATAWLHEFAHLAMRGPRPSAGVTQRFVAALEEGFADTIAALLAGTPLVGGGSLPERNLAATNLLPTVWEELALEDRYAPHPLGLRFARQLWKHRDVLHPLDLAGCLREASELATTRTISGAVQHITESCPSSTARHISTVFNSWLPPSFRSSSNK